MNSILTTICRGATGALTVNTVKDSLHSKYGVAIEGNFTREDIQLINSIHADKDQVSKFLGALYTLRIKTYDKQLMTEVSAYTDEFAAVWITTEVFINSLLIKFGGILVSDKKKPSTELIDNLLTPAVLKGVLGHYKRAMTYDEIKETVYYAAQLIANHKLKPEDIAKARKSPKEKLEKVLKITIGTMQDAVLNSRKEFNADIVEGELTPEVLDLIAKVSMTQKKITEASATSMLKVATEGNLKSLQVITKAY